MADMFSGLHEGQRFSSLEAFKTTMRTLSVRQHWDMRMVRSNKKNVSVGCRSAVDCPFRVICRSNKNATHITNLNDTHTCRRGPAGPVPTSSSRSEVSHVRFLLAEVPKLFDMREKVMGQQIVDAVKRYHGYDISIRQAQRVLTKLQPRYRTRKVRPDQMDLQDGSSDQQIHQESEYQESASRPEFRQLDDDRDEWLEDPGFPSALLTEDMASPNNTQQPSEAHSYRPMDSQRSPDAVQHIPTNISYAPHHAQQPMTGSLYPPHHTQQTSSNAQYPPATAQTPLPNDHPQNIHHLQQSPQKQPDESLANQLMLTNFKVEFKCTSCGAFNRSFIPNQGHGTGGNDAPNNHNAPHHSIGAGLE